MTRTKSSNRKTDKRKEKKKFPNSSMLSFVRTQSHHRFSSFFSAANPLRSHSSAVRSVGAALPITHFTRTQFHQFSTNLNPNHHHHQRRQETRYMDLEPDKSNSVSAAAGGCSSSEDYVHVDDVTAPDVSYSEEESVVDDERRGEEGDEALSASGGRVGENERRELPGELASSVMKLTCESMAEGGVCDVYLVGTAHVSSESCQQVQAVISLLEPQVVFLELCASRVTVLQPQNLKIPTVGDMMEMWRKNHNLFGILYGWFLAKVASKLEVLPGAEFRVAYEEAMKYGGRVILGDRPVQITLRRTWAKMPLWHKTKLLSSLLFQAVSLPSTEALTKMLKDMDDVDMLTLVIQEMSKQFPTLMETLVHERDKYMSSSLLRVAREHKSVVAVVGKGHLPGIKRHWKQPIEVKELLIIPTGKPTFSAGKILASIGVAVAGVAIVSGIYLSSKK